MLLAMAGKVSSDLQEIIRKRPQLFADLIRQLKTMPDHAILRIARTCVTATGKEGSKYHDRTTEQSTHLSLPEGP